MCERERDRGRERGSVFVYMSERERERERRRERECVCIYMFMCVRKKESIYPALCSKPICVSHVLITLCEKARRGGRESE